MTTSSGFDDVTLRRFADLIVGFGANVQPGQIVVDRRRHRQGGDRPRARRERLPARREVRRRLVLRPARQARADALRRRGHARLRAVLVRRARSSRSATSAARASGSAGPIAPGLLDDIDPARIGRDQLPFLRESGKVVNDATTNWTIGPCPSVAVGDARPSRTSSRTRRSRASSSSSCTSCGSTRRTRSPPGRARADALVDRRDAADRAALRRAALRGPGHRPARSGCCRRAASAPRASRPSTASSTCRTSRPRRSSARPTRSAPRASCARRSRSSSAARSSAASRSSSATGASTRIDADENADVLRGYAVRTRAPRGWARSRSSTARAASASSGRRSSTRCSTRTRRATSRSGRRTPSASRTRPTTSA